MATNPEQELRAGTDLSKPEYFINRELSQLAFNQRVFELAKDERVPLLERLRFLCITSSNLDEFFEVRVAGLVQQAELGGTQTGPDGLTPQDALSRISRMAHELVSGQYAFLNDVLLPALEGQGIRFRRREEWDVSQRRFLQEFFENEVMPVITPIRLDPAHPFPRTLNKSLNFIVLLKGNDAFGNQDGMAIVPAPRALPRLIRIPQEISHGPNDFAFLSSVIHTFVNQLFPGMESTGCYQFRVTRNSDLFVDTEEVDDLLRALEGELPSRRYGDAVRLEVADNCPEGPSRFLLRKFELAEQDLYQVKGPVNLGRMIALPDMVDRPDLKYPSFTPGMPKQYSPGANIFTAIHNGDILLHHPFQSFTPVVEFMRQAAEDPSVLAIKQTLYRTGLDSVLVQLLMEAARADKEVTVVVELRARFDEEANIEIATKLQEAGVHVVYGIVGYKTHAKMLMVVRREQNHLVRYVHLGTGNYHYRTARLYTDYGLFTCDPDIGDDVHKIFMQLTTHSKLPPLKRLLHSPFTLQSGVIDRIDREAENVRAGRPARIIAKVNGLVSAQVIAALYAASCAGVKIDLIVRGVCCLKPGVEGVSENITVHSIVGRFLEHTRVYYFENGGTPELYCSSADWMPRNLIQRVEQCFPILNLKLKQRIIRDLKLYLEDNAFSWVMDATGQYHRQAPEEGEERLSAQDRLLEEYREH
ncbi:MAG: polyphosphate kinase 1 [Arenicellales bacterium]